MRSFRTSVVLLVALCLTAPLSAQSRGGGRMSGKVVDEAGKPIIDVEVKAVKVGEAQVFQTKTDRKGEWALGGLAGGEWNIDFAKPGLETVQQSAFIRDGQRLPQLAITMRVAPPDPREGINKEMERAAEHIKGGRVADARKIYEDLLVKFPTVHQFHNFIGRTYAAENNMPKAIEHVKIALEKEPDNAETKLLLAELLQTAGQKDEAKAILDTVDVTQAKDPFVFVNVAINYINDNKAPQAIELLTKLIAQFPNETQLLYYRGRAYLASSKFDEAKADLEKFVAANPTTAQKELEDAKKILEQLVKK
jgi:tetratricopeptide (TPR) repeat protein